ncbi:hypothetical protein KEM52_001265, partial [Ascosphaera acerosa]
MSFSAVSQRHAADVVTPSISPQQPQQQQSQSQSQSQSPAHRTATAGGPGPSPPDEQASPTRTPVTQPLVADSFPTPASSICGRPAGLEGGNNSGGGGSSSYDVSMDGAGPKVGVGADDASHSARPAHSSSHRYDHDHDAAQRRRPHEEAREGADPMDLDPASQSHTHRHTNHDRQGHAGLHHPQQFPSPQQSPNLEHGKPPPPPPSRATGPGPGPGPAAAATTTTPAPTPAPFTAEFGRTLHLCKRSAAPAGPNVSIDLLSLYGLGPVARSVARNDLVTGEKINRLRKSYEGKIKALGPSLLGRNKAVRHEPGQPGGLLELLTFPDEEWRNQRVFGREIRPLEPGSEMHRLVQRAARCEPGTLPNAAQWEDLLGYEKVAKTGAGAESAAAATAAGLPQQSRDSVARRPSSFVASPLLPASSSSRAGSVAGSAAPSPSFSQSEYAANRPRRAGKKRSYQDHSFMGYGEGFADDDPDADSAFDGGGGGGDDGSAKGGKKKRRK